MEGRPAQFEAIGSRLGFRVADQTPDRLLLVWQGTRFPAFLCLGIALALLFLSLPIAEAIFQKGFQIPAGSLWYFPVMNMILFGISLFLLSLKRTILLNHKERKAILEKRSLFRRTTLRIDYDEIEALRLATDQVYGGFAVAGSSAAERYPASSLRLVLKSGETVLVDRGGKRRLENLGKELSAFLEKPFESEQGAAQ